MKINFFSAVRYVHFIIEQVLVKDNVIIDCTCGNGNDSLFLLNKMQGTGVLYGFDIQPEAIERTEKLLSLNSSYNNYVLVNDSHENLLSYVNKSPGLAIYNLGYLPNHNSNITTIADTTVNSMAILLKILKINGFVIVTSYKSHDNGKENMLLKNFLEKLNNNYYSVAIHKNINFDFQSPEIFIIKKNNVQS